MVTSDRPHSIEDVLAKLQHVKPAGPGKWTADCPCPGHKTPAGHLSIADAGTKAQMRHFPEGTHDYASICLVLGFASLNYGSNGQHSTPTIDATYDYLDAEGNLAYQVVRYLPKDFRYRRPDGKGGWVWKMGNIQPVLYNLPAVRLAASGGDTVIIAEGEKDCNNIGDKLNYPATCNPFGAGKWRAEYSKHLTGARVVVVADKDEVGRKHAQDVARSLYGKVKSLRVVELPERGEIAVKDVSDWLEGGLMADGDPRTEFDAIIDAAPEWTPTTTPPPAQPSQSETVRTRLMSTVQAEAVNFLWFPYIPIGKLTMIEGDPGAGKSWLSLAVATAVTLGHGLPGMAVTQPARVFLASAEDGLADTIRPRLDALHADAGLVHAADELFTLDDVGLVRLENTVKGLTPTLMIVDPLVAYFDGGVDIHKANMVRHVTSQLARLAETYSMAVLCVRHLTKAGSSKPIYRGLGSIDFTAAARSVLLAGVDADTGDRGFVHIKCNLAPLGKAVGYQLTEGQFYWTGESELTAARIFEMDAGDNVRDKAKTWLRLYLADGEKPANEVYKAANEAGLKERTLNTAKREMKVGSRKDGKVWFWFMGDTDA